MEDVLVLFGIFAFPFLFERLVRRFWIAIILSALSMSALLHIVGWIRDEYIDPSYVISVPVSLFAFLVWSILTIWVIRRIRQRGTLFG